MDIVSLSKWCGRKVIIIKGWDGYSEMIFTLNGITFTQVSNTHKLNNQILFDQYFTLSKWYPFIGV